MDMKMIEIIVLAAGISLLARFILISLAPFLRKRLEIAAEKRSMDLREEFLLLPPRKILGALAAAGLASGTTAFALAGSISIAAAAAIGPAVSSGLAVRHYRLRRRRRVISQMPGFLDVLAGQIKAGHSMQEALSHAIPLLPRDIRLEISWVYRLCRLGTPLQDAFLQWEERLPCEEVSFVVRPLRAALPSGSNVADLLCRSRDILRARTRMQEKMRSMTAQARLQAVVLTLLPPVFAAVLSKIDPGFLPRCLGTAPGIAIIAASAMLQILGWLTIRKILSVKP